MRFALSPIGSEVAVEDGEQSVTSYKLQVVCKVRKFIKLESKQENAER